MDCREECLALRREVRRLLKRCADLHAEVLAEKKRADDAEAWALELVRGRAA